MMVTALASEQSKSYAMDSGADIFIVKPFDVDLLLKDLANGLAIRSSEAKRVTSSNDIKKPKVLPNHIGVSIAASTGGPPVLIKLLNGLDKTLNCAYFIVQHGPEWMLKTFSDRLELQTGYKTVLARNNVKVEAGKVYIAPGDYQYES